MIFNYAGYAYDTWVEYEEDNRKIFHSVYKHGKLVKSIDFTPYRQMSFTDFMNYIDLGMPSRINKGPLTSEGLQYLKDTAAFCEGHSFT